MKQGFRPKNTFCLIQDYVVELVKNDKQQLLCSLPSSFSRIDSQQVQLYVSNFVHDPVSVITENVVFVANFSVVQIGFFERPLDSLAYPKRMILGHLKPLILSSDIRGADYDAYSNLRINCMFFYLDFTYERQCQFTSAGLQEISVNTEQMPPGVFSIRVQFNGIIAEFQDVLSLKPQPVFLGVYPNIVHISLQTAQQHFVVKGRNFDILQSGISCVLTFESSEKMLLSATLKDNELI